MSAHDPRTSDALRHDRRLERRAFLRVAFGAAGLAAASSLLAACGNAQPTAAPAATSAPAKPAEAAKPAAVPPTNAPAAPAAAAQPTTAPGAPAAAAKGSGKLEMFSWWTTAGEEAGLKAMY